MLYRLTPGQRGSFTVKRLVGDRRLDRLAAQTYHDHSGGPKTRDAVRDLPEAALAMLQAEFDIAPPA